MGGRVVHFEIPFDDGQRARAFYQEVFGWTVQEMPALDYTFVTTGPAGADGMPTEPGFIGGGMSARGGALERPVITVDTDDIEATLATVTAHGGEVVQGKTEIPGMGHTAYVRDSEGNVVGLWQSA